MNILIITSWYPVPENPTNGKFVMEQVKVISQDNKVVLVFPMKLTIRKRLSKRKIKKVFKQKNYVLIRPVFLKFPFITQINYIFSILILFCKIRNRYNFDLVHAQITSPAGYAALIIKYLFKLPFVLTEHRGPFSEIMDSIKSRFLIKFTMNHSDALIANCKTQVKEIKMYGIKKEISVVPCVIDMSEFQLKEWKKEHEKIKLLIIGGMQDYRKGLIYLLKALPKIKDKFDFELKIVGKTGNLKEEYLELVQRGDISRQCIFIDYLTEERLREAYREADIFVLPSLHENFGVVLIEAIATGTPVITTYCGGPEDYVEENNGMLVAKENEDELAFAIEKMISNLNKYEPIKVRKTIEDKFSQQTFKKKVNMIYFEVLNKKRKQGDFKVDKN